MRKGLVWTLAVALNVAATVFVTFLTVENWRHLADEELLMTGSISVYIAFNWYFTFRAKNTGEWIEETLIGLRIRARKERFRREIERQRGADS